MADNITQCPKCSTSFRITEAHLKSAKGSVRCGSCLNIFNARDNLIVSTTAEDTSVENNGEQEAQVQQDSIGTDHAAHTEQNTDIETSDNSAEEDELISDNMGSINDTSALNISGDDYSDEFNESVIFGRDSAKADVNLFERELIASEDDEEANSDESWALDLLETDEHKAIEEEVEPEVSSVDDLESSEGYHGDTHLEDSESDTEEELHSEFKPSSFQLIEDEADYEEALQQQANEISEEDYGYGDHHSFEEPDTHSSASYLDAIEPEPVEFAVKKHFSIWHSTPFWATLALITAILLVGQIAWIKFDSWSRLSPYRAYYQIACDQLGCTLPALIDRKQIRTANLVVRSHPKHDTALLVDAVIQNTAPFNQTFPVLDLVFTDAQNKTVAARRFSPREYLRGELAGRTEMLTNQPVHIAIEIADPGKAAVGYHISIPDL